MSMFLQSRNERLVRDMKSVVSNAEAILRTTADQAGGKVDELQTAMSVKLADARDRMVALEEAVIAQAKKAARNTDDYVHENPWQSLALVGGLVFLIGILIAPRRG